METQWYNQSCINKLMGAGWPTWGGGTSHPVPPYLPLIDYVVYLGAKEVFSIRIYYENKFHGIDRKEKIHGIGSRVLIYVALPLRNNQYSYYMII